MTVQILSVNKSEYQEIKENFVSCSDKANQMDA